MSYYDIRSVFMPDCQQGRPQPEINPRGPDPGGSSQTTEYHWILHSSRDAAPYRQLAGPDLSARLQCQYKDI